MNALLIGADPEVFVQQNGIFKSAWNLIKGSKSHPQPVQRGAVQVDGMALEFNTDPAATEDEFSINIATVFEQLKAMVPEYHVVATPVAHFDAQYFKEQPEEALELGCDPDYNGWLLAPNPRPEGERPFRTASGHVHVGWILKGEEEQQHFAHAAAVARQLDFYLALPSLVYDKDTQRRELYGKAGAFRVKPYGMEYRTLSNAWLNSDELVRWVFRAASKGFKDMHDGKFLPGIEGDIQEIVNTSDVDAAMVICNKHNIEVPNVR